MKGNDQVSLNATPNATPANPFESEANLSARTAAQESALPLLKSALDAATNATAAMKAAGDAVVGSVRTTYGVLIDGTYYPDLFATQQDTKNGVSDWLKANGIPTGSEDHASTFRYHFTNAAKRLFDANPDTYRPAGFVLSSGKWVREVVLTPDQQATIQHESAVKDAVKGRSSRILAEGLVRQANGVTNDKGEVVGAAPVPVLDAVAFTLSNLNIGNATMLERANIHAALESIMAAADRLMSEIMGVPAAA